MHLNMGRGEQSTKKINCKAEGQKVTYMLEIIEMMNYSQVVHIN